MSAGAPRAPVRGLASSAAQRVPALVDLYRFMRHPGWELAVRRDLRTTRDLTRGLRAMEPLSDEAPTVLLGLYRDDIYETKLGLVLASALRMQGYRVVVLIPSRRAWRAARYADAFGVSEVVDLESVDLSGAEIAKRSAILAELNPARATFDDVLGWEVEGRQLGVHLLATLIRLTFDGDPDLSDPAMADLASSILDDLLDNYLRLEHLLDDIDPDVLLVEESNYSQNGPLVDLAVDRGIDVIRTIAIWREDALMSRRITPSNRRVDAKSVDAATISSLDPELTPGEQDELWKDFDHRYGGAWDLGSIFQPDTVDHTGEAIVQDLGLDPGRPTAVVFAHVLWDASLSYGDDLFRNHAEWLVETVRAAVDNPAVNWLVKAHPSNVYRAAHGDVAGESREIALLRDEFATLPDHVTVLVPETPISTRSLYEFADVGLTVRGTPGLEMACVGKPVLTAGTGHYSGLGFTLDSTSVVEYLERCGKVQDLPPMDPAVVDRARRYAHTLFLRRPWLATTFSMTYGIDDQDWHPLYRNVDLVDGSPDALRRSSDLVPWSEWVVGSRAPDYLPPRGAAGAGDDSVGTDRTGHARR